MQSLAKCVLLVINTMALWQLMHLHDMPQSHCGDNQEGKLFSCIRVSGGHIVFMCTSIRLDIYGKAETDFCESQKHKLMV